MKTNAKTVNGNDKDQFHFTRDTAEDLKNRLTATSAGYGIALTFIRSAPPREIRIAYVEPNSPAAAAGLTRGLKIISVDGEDVENGTNVAKLNGGLFPDATGETHTLGIEALDGTQSTVSVTSAEVTRAPVNESKTFERGGRKYGYVHFTTFGSEPAEKALFDAFADLQSQNIDDIVLDLRYNGGGFLAIASQLSYMIAGADRTNNKTFSEQVFNNKANGINPVTGAVLRPTPFYKTGVDFTVATSVDAPSVNKPRVFVLTTGRTCSASEAVMNGLRGIDVEVIQIGTRTCGKPFGFYGTDNCGTTYHTIQFKSVNAKGFGEYADGFAPGQVISTAGDVMPGCQVPDDFGNALGDPSEALLSSAVTYAETGACPANTVAVASAKADTFSFAYDPKLDLLKDPRVQAMEMDRVAMDYGLPE
ncbi:S41 family peptidase [uncultured Algimonas sp.]|uniref:S41 family peptidase n=1 Tax=uncultured Algimonas sp. TaxID=1547920 RepID=UPI00344D27C0